MPRDSNRTIIRRIPVNPSEEILSTDNLPSSARTPRIDTSTEIIEVDPSELERRILDRLTRENTIRPTPSPTSSDIRLPTADVIDIIGRQPCSREQQRHQRSTSTLRQAAATDVQQRHPTSNPEDPGVWTEFAINNVKTEIALLKNESALTLLINRASSTSRTRILAMQIIAAHDGERFSFQRLNILPYERARFLRLSSLQGYRFIHEINKP